jgi:hypothetical protein
MSIRVMFLNSFIQLDGNEAPQQRTGALVQAVKIPRRIRNSPGNYFLISSVMCPIKFLEADTA